MKIPSTFSRREGLCVLGAQITGPSTVKSVELVLDTGAVYTTLTPGVAEGRLGYSRQGARATVIRTAVGNERGYLIKVAQITVLGLVFRNVAVNVADLGYGVDGLLGLNILDQLNYEVRSREFEIRAEKI